MDKKFVVNGYIVHNPLCDPDIMDEKAKKRLQKIEEECAKHGPPVWIIK